MTDSVNLHETRNAAVWASEFCKRWPSALCQIPGKEGVQDGNDWEGTMIAWFANAIMAGEDSAAAQIAATRAQALAEAAAVVKALYEKALKASDADLSNDCRSHRAAAYGAAYAAVLDLASDGLTLAPTAPPASATP